VSHTAAENIVSLVFWRTRQREDLALLLKAPPRVPEGGKARKQQKNTKTKHKKKL
jgi:hypothetical protein